MNSRIAKTRIYKLLNRYDEKIVDYYLENGPVKLKEKLNIKSDFVWRVIYDYLIYEKEVVKVCVRNNTKYVHKIFADKGPNAIREAFFLENEKYEEAWEYVLDYIGISRGALYEFVARNQHELCNLIFKGKSYQIRERLGITKTKYEKVWEEILDILLECVATDTYSYSTYEHGLRAFVRFYNAGRTHRSVKKTCRRSK